MSDETDMTELIKELERQMKTTTNAWEIRELEHEISHLMYPGPCDEACRK